MFSEINELAVLVTAILSVAVGSIWYSPLLFGTVWAKGAGVVMDERDATKQHMLLATAKAVLVQTAFFCVVALFIGASRDAALPLSMLGAMFSALCILYMMHMVVWEKRPLSYTLVNAGYSVLILFGGIGIIAFWPW